MDPRFLLALAGLLSPQPVPHVPHEDMMILAALSGAISWEQRDWIPTYCNPRQVYQEWISLPPLSDCSHFPPREVSAEYLAFNRQYRSHLELLLLLYPLKQEEIREIICETDDLYQVWDAIRDSQYTFYSDKTRRQSLQKVRHLLGEKVYREGLWPPCVPVWYFTPR